MKKLLSSVMSLFLAATLTGCGSSSAPKPSSAPDDSGKASAAPETDKTPEPSAVSPRDQVYKVGDTVTTDDFEITLTDARIVDKISTQADDTFLTEVTGAENSGDVGFLIYNAEFKYLGSYEDDFARPLAVDMYGIGNTYYSSEFLCAFRKTGENWQVTVCSPLFTSIAQSLGADPTARFTFEPSDQTYQARGVLRVTKEDVKDQTVTINLQKYQFEIGK
ncbi:MAG: hypothetical protein K6A40_11230 [Solobacterium sp.]|nr:hypothetical protein [Solobacterium sp.]